MFNIFKNKNETEKRKTLIIGATVSGKGRSYLVPSKVQYNLLLETIGFEREKLKDNKFIMWRNILQLNKNVVDMDLKFLMSLGLGVLEEDENSLDFYVSREGIDFISMIEKCEIDYNHFFDEGWDND